MVAAFGAGVFAGGQETRPVEGPLELRVRLVQNGVTPEFAVTLHNRLAHGYEIAYSECTFAFEIFVGGRRLRYPNEQRFAFSSPCRNVQRFRRFAPGQTVLLFTRGVLPDTERAVRVNAWRFTGEFRFTYAERDVGGFRVAAQRVR